MTTALEYEQKTGVMVRKITGVVKKRLQDVMDKLYDPKYTGPGDYVESAKDWRSILTDICVETDGSLSKYLKMIKMALNMELDLWKDEDWKSQMCIDLPIQFRKRIDTLTMVPKIASMDEVREEIPKKEEFW